MRLQPKRDRLCSGTTRKFCRSFGKHIIKHALPPIAVLLCALLAAAAVFSCSSDPAEPRQIRGHTLTFDGIAHGTGAARAERYCTLCHGENLAGGEKAKPSCYNCHGKNWLDHDPLASPAPADHTVINGIFRHHPSLHAPAATCTSCHGANLEGDASFGQSLPSCFLCHDQNWQ